MANNRKVNVVQHSSMGVLWFIGWLFTVGFMKFGFWAGLWALIVWPYHMGTYVAGIVG